MSEASSDTADTGQSGQIRRRGKSANKQSAPLWAVVVAALALVGFFVYLYRANFGPPPVAPLTADEIKNRTVIAEFIKKTDGDRSKLSAEDRDALFKIAGPYWGMAWGDVQKNGIKPF